MFGSVVEDHISAVNREPRIVNRKNRNHEKAKHTKGNGSMKDANGFIKRDPAVEAAIYGGDKRQADRGLPREQRARKKKAQERQDARNGRRAVYDMDPCVIRNIAEIAEHEGCSASNVAEIALHLFLDAHVCLDEYRVPVQHPRFECKLVWKE